MDSKISAIGIIEVSCFSNSVYLADVMLKTANIEIIRIEKLLGGALVTIVFKGTISQIDAALENAIQKNHMLPGKPLKSSFSISNPHSEILKFLYAVK